MAWQLQPLAAASTSKSCPVAPESQGWRLTPPIPSYKMFKRTIKVPPGDHQDPLSPKGPDEHPPDCEGRCCVGADGSTEFEDHTGLNARANSAQGKVAELRQELTGGTGKKDKNHTAKKNALKKIVANMTMSNNDMVALFQDVINCMQIQSTEIKKM